MNKHRYIMIYIYIIFIGTVALQIHFGYTIGRILAISGVCTRFEPFRALAGTTLTTLEAEVRSRVFPSHETIMGEDPWEYVRIWWEYDGNLVYNIMGIWYIYIKPSLMMGIFCIIWCIKTIYLVIRCSKNQWTSFP